MTILSSLRRFACDRAHLGEGERIGHDMIGGKRHDDRIVAAAERISRARDNGRTGIPPHRFEQNVGFRTDRRELLGDQEAILPIGHDHRPAKQSRIGHASDGFLESRQRPEQRQELLRPIFARGRPQPRPGAAAHDEGNDRLRHFTLALLYTSRRQSG